VEVELSVDGEGRKVFTFEDEKVAVRVVLKKDYSTLDSDLRNNEIIKDVEAALEAAFGTDDFKDFVDSSGLLYRGKVDMD
jgi:hypothetical protein